MGIVALFALIEHSGSLIGASGLHDVVFHFRIIAFRAFLFDDHFGFPSFFLEGLAGIVFHEPFFIFPYVKFGLDWPP